ncbi:hypothetical protein GGS23DRAFT_370423 [Durotheca rogersii]|uniref:uncharacterized protein n=1 Tax=Durotheca rogersii TaxID=419775 RepID=UPI0022211CD6|nr:uncharacterized protein GGS23DRAFT_370423 [Durotheca rogersii]KAI5866118.1 hypothetical protein GGS23DRAFT_370423 [Durotheca rogersii]
MPSADGFEPSMDDGSVPNESRGKPWPFYSPAQQINIEKKYFEEGATIHFDRLPPLQWWAPLTAVSEGVRVGYITKKTVEVSVAANRRLTADEVNAASEHAARSVRYHSYVPLLSLSLTCFITWGGRKTFRFPFYTPKRHIFDPRVFPMRSRAYFRGWKAVQAWHAARFLSFLPLTWLGSLLFINSVAEATYDAHMVRDIRLRYLLQDVKRNVGNVREPNERRRLHQNPPARPGTDASPPAPEHERDTYGSRPENTFHESTTGPAGNVAAQPPTESNWARSAPLPPPPAKYPDSGSRYTGDLDLFGDDGDDASPLSASSRRAEAQRARDSQGGSAWDRIRQQSQQGNSAQWDRGDSSDQERGWAHLRQDRTQDPKERSPRTDGFSYSQQDEERERRNYEREQAQKEFDALLESERRGGSGRQ